MHGPLRKGRCRRRHWCLCATADAREEGGRGHSGHLRFVSPTAPAIGSQDWWLLPSKDDFQNVLGKPSEPGHNYGKCPCLGNASEPGLQEVP